MQNDGKDNLPTEPMTAGEERDLFPNGNPNPLPATPNATVEKEIAHEINAEEAKVDTANDVDPTAPLPGTELEISEPKREEIPTTDGDVPAIHWTASEAIDHQRGFGWYLVAGLITAAIVGVSVWQWQTLWSLGALALIVFVALVVITRRPARMVNYTLTSQGLYIEDKLHPFDEFRAFGVRQEGALWSIVLIPVKRFGLAVTMFITEDQGEKIVDAFGAVLPMENVAPDVVDRLTRRLKM